MNIFAALGFMALGGLIVEIFEVHAWRRYQQGKAEGRGLINPTGTRR